MRALLVRTKFGSRIISVGNKGIKYFRVKNTIKKDGNEKNRAVFTLANLFCKYRMEAKAEVTPTISSEYAVAMAGSNLNI
jgi:hypothetical protein